VPYLQPKHLTEAVDALAGPGMQILAGGTDLYPAHVGRPLPGRLVDVSAVVEMRAIAACEDGLRIGGAVTWTEIASAGLPPAFKALQQAARQVGSRQVQNRGTVAGNLCNASPAADGVPPLLVLDASVELTSAAGARQMALADFIVGYRKTQLRPDEVLSAVIVPASPGAISAFVKLGARKYLVISIVMVAALLRCDKDGTITQARIAVGSASEKARRLELLERHLIGRSARGAMAEAIQPEHLAVLSPIGDIRATAAFRLDAARHLIADALERAAGA